MMYAKEFWARRHAGWTERCEGRRGCDRREMFGRERWEAEMHGRPEGFGHGRRGGRFGREMGGGRLFDAGDLKLVILKLLEEQPSYGYQLIKTMEQRLAGGYTPSAGVIYPTLTMLEEEGLATVATSEAGKKVYSVTAEGHTFLTEHQGRVDQLFARMEEAGRGFERERSPEIMRAFMELRSAVIRRVSRGHLTTEQLVKIAAAIRAAAKSVDEVG